MKRHYLALLFVLLATVARAQLSITPSTLSFSQDFNTLDTVGLSSNLPFGWYLFESGTSAQVDGQYRGGFGNGTAGNTYSYGRPDSTDRALGSLSSFTLAPRYGVLFVNNSGEDVTSAAIAFRGEMWRQGSISNTQPDTLQLYWSATADSISDTTAQWTEIPALMFLSPANAGNAGFRDGNVDSNNTDLAYTLIFPTPIPTGDSIFLRWTDINTTASDDGLSVDDFSITFTTAPPDVSPVLLSTNPPDDATSVPAGLNTISATFDRGISAGTGNIYLLNLTAGTTDTIAAQSSQVSTSGNTVTVAGIALNALTDYAVRMDSAAFDTAGYYIAGVYDDTTWNFSTDTGLMIVWTDPADNSTGIAAGLDTLRFSLNDSVDFTGSGAIRLYNLTDGAQQMITGYTVAGDTVSFTAPLLPFRDYAVRIDAFAFGNDSAGWLPIIDNDTFWNFSTGNYAEDFSPVLLSTIPPDNATNVAPSLTALQMTFDRGVSAGSGNIYLLNLTASTTDTIAAQSAQVSIADSVVTVSGIALGFETDYAVRMDSTAFDTIGFYTAGIYDDTTWNFSTAPAPPDVSPIIVVTNPADNATDVPHTTTTISVTFDRGISAGAGFIHILNLTDSDTQTIAANSASVTITDSTAAISNVALLPNKAYAVRIDSTAFDTAGYFFAGIYNDTAWNFFTEDTTGISPNPYISAFNPPDNSTGVATSILPSVTFTQPVQRGSGKVYMKDATANQLIEFPANSIALTIDSNKVTIAFNLQAGHDYYILMDSAVFKDMSGNPIARIDDSTTWNFSTVAATGIADAQGNAAFRMAIAGQGRSATTHLVLTLAADAPVDMIAVDGAGRVVRQWRVDGKAGTGFYAIPFEAAPGIYYLQGRSALGEGRAKMMVAQ